MFDYRFTLQAVAGVSTEINARGRSVFYYEETTGAVDPSIIVTALGGEGGAFELRPGEGVRMPSAATGFKVTNIAGAAILEGVLKIGDGDFAGKNIAGSVSIAGTPEVNVSDRAGRLLGVIYGTLGQVAQVLIGGVNAIAAYCYGTLGALAQASIGGVNALQVTSRGITYGASYQANSGMAANTSATVFSAASNTNGAIVWRAGGRSFNATQFTNFSLIAHTVAPNSTTTGDVLAMGDSGAETGTDRAIFLKIEGPIFVPAGKGVYFNSSVAETDAYRHCLYTLL